MMEMHSETGTYFKKHIVRFCDCANFTEYLCMVLETILDIYGFKKSPIKTCMLMGSSYLKGAYRIEVILVNP